LIAEGEEDQVKDLLAWSQHGPSTARVDKVDTRWRSYTGEFADFKIVNE
jgi:acylphosphatase